MLNIIHSNVITNLPKTGHFYESKLPNFSTEIGRA